ncbi:MAG: hypothetical protein GXO15_03150 [Crenarchaeota archaeon]|nr:hypothetical protein [Thermoproteota archaeon]
MHAGRLAALALLAVALLSASAAALTMEEAKQLFQQRGCTSCHNGNLAPDFEGTVKKMQEWAQKYGSLDEAVKAEAKNFKMYQNSQSWDQLINAMPGITPELRQFFEQVFEQAKGGAAGGEAAAPAGEAAAAKTITVTVTTTAVQTVVKTVTQTVTVKEVITETVTPPEYDPGTGRAVASAGFVAAVIVAVSVVILAYIYLGRS